MKKIACAVFLSLFLGFAACSPPSPELVSNWVTPIQTALTTSSRTLAVRAIAGEAHAQYALAIQMDHGLGGAARDPARARFLRTQALASRGNQLTTTWVAGVNGRPGYPMFISTPRYDMTAAEAEAIEACVAWIVTAVQTGSQAPGDDPVLCGGPQHRGAYLALWVSTISHNIS